MQLLRCNKRLQFHFEETHYTTGSVVSALPNVSSLNSAAPLRRRHPFGRDHVINRQDGYSTNGVAAAQRFLPACPPLAISALCPPFTRPNGTVSMGPLGHGTGPCTPSWVGGSYEGEHVEAEHPACASAGHQLPWCSFVGVKVLDRRDEQPHNHLRLDRAPSSKNIAEVGSQVRRKHERDR